MLINVCLRVCFNMHRIGHAADGDGHRIRFNICGHLSPLDDGEDFDESQRVNCFVSRRPDGRGHICGRDPIKLTVRNNNRTSEFESFLVLHFMNGSCFAGCLWR
jgi:hypothetical protein